MKNSWTHFFRRVARTGAFLSATAMSSAMCYAQLAYDDATDPVYDDGWDEGDNGGSGFGPWSFDGTYDTLDPGGQAMDDGLQTGTQASSQHNDIGRAWTMFNQLGPTPGPEPNDGTDIARAGRALGGPLLVHQKLKVIIDNPTERNFFRGYNVKLVSGSENLCFEYHGTHFGCTTGDTNGVVQAKVETFEYFTYGQWVAWGGTGGGTGGSLSVFDTDTNSGTLITIERSAYDRFTATIDPLGPGPTYSQSGLMTDPDSPIDWVQFEMWASDSDTYPTLMSPRGETDFYIRSMQIVPEPGSAILLLLGTGGFLLGFARRSDEKRL
jgi:hypothetical protein